MWKEASVTFCREFLLCRCGYMELTLPLHIRSHSREAHPGPPTCEVAAPAARPVLFCDPAVMMTVSSQHRLVADVTSRQGEPLTVKENSVGLTPTGGTRRRDICLERYCAVGHQLKVWNSGEETVKTGTLGYPGLRQVFTSLGFPVKSANSRSVAWWWCT
jgi:hypothetical protein